MQSIIEKNSISTIVITVIAIVVIIVLAYFLYYSTLIQPPVMVDQRIPMHYKKNNNTITQEKIKKAQVAIANSPTVVITFETPNNLPEVKKQGKCFSNSIAEPFRQDAWMCMVGNTIYDPCFGATQDTVFCQTNPLADNAFVINTTQPLPKNIASQTQQNNWAWFVELADGTDCTPFTGTRPFSNDETAYYNCESDTNTKGEQVVLLGDLVGGTTWMANKAILVQDTSGWSIESSEQVPVKEVWQ